MIEQFIQQEFWDVVVFGNPVHAYVLMLFTLVVSLTVLRFLQHFVLERLRIAAQKTATEVDDVVINVIDSLKPPFYFFFSIYLSTRAIELVPTADKILSAILVLWLMYQIVIALEIIMEFSLTKKISEGGDDDRQSANMLRFFINTIIWTLGLILAISNLGINTVIWTLGLILALSNLGINVTSLLAGLGIGGIAVAIAAQNILGDLFSSFVIHIDKPFRVGDFITVGNDSGTVEHIGLKTTRLRGLSGEMLIISNKELTSVRLQNFKEMNERRVVFHLDVEYGTDDKKLKQIPSWIKDIIESIEKTRFDRSHFKTLSESSLKFETVYFVSTPEYIDFMNIQQEINLAVHKKMNDEKIGIAYPTQTIYTRKG